MATRGRKKKQLAGVDLYWSEDDEEAFKIVLRLLTAAIKTYFADPTAEVCLFTDASNVGWAVVLTQVQDWEPAKLVVDHSHELLVCQSGLLRGAEVNWSVIKKEVCPVVRASADLSYLLEREKGFRIFCDHVNLVEIAPAVSDLRPLQDLGFPRPATEDIRRAQARARADAPTDAVEREGLLYVGERVLLPADARDLVKRIMIVARCGLQGHHGEHVMVEVLKRHFDVVRIRATVSRLPACLFCKHVKGGKLISMSGTRPQWRRSGMSASISITSISVTANNDAQYVLVLKDELTHFCELVAADSTTSLTAADGYARLVQALWPTVGLGVRQRLTLQDHAVGRVGDQAQLPPAVRARLYPMDQWHRGTCELRFAPSAARGARAYGLFVQMATSPAPVAFRTKSWGSVVPRRRAHRIPDSVPLPTL